MNLTSSTEKWTRRGLCLCAAWNLLGGGTALADPAAHFAQMYSGTLAMNDPLQAFFFRVTWINVIAWGVGYWIAARLPNARTAVLCAGGAGKLGYFAACMALIRSGGGSAFLAGAALFDVVCAVFFFYVVWSQKR
jgi:hypothetical protein